MAFAYPGIIVLVLTNYFVIFEVIVFFGIIHNLLRFMNRHLVIRWIVETVLLIVFTYVMHAITISLAMIFSVDFIDFLSYIYIFFLSEFKELIEFTFWKSLFGTIDFSLLLLSSRLLIAILIPTAMFLYSLITIRNPQKLPRKLQLQAVVKNHNEILNRRIVQKYGGLEPQTPWGNKRVRCTIEQGYFIFDVLTALVISISINGITNPYELTRLLLSLVSGLIVLGIYVFVRHWVRHYLARKSPYHATKLLFDNFVINLVCAIITTHLTVASYYSYRLSQNLDMIQLLLIFITVTMFALVNSVRLLIMIKVRQNSFKLDHNPAESNIIQSPTNE
jgi:hypothetical protein